MKGNPNKKNNKMKKNLNNRDCKDKLEGRKSELQGGDSNPDNKDNGDSKVKVDKDNNGGNNKDKEDNLDRNIGIKPDSNYGNRHNKEEISSD